MLNRFLVLQTLITSKTRIKLLMKFFLNSSMTSYLRDLASEFGESTNAIRLELNRMEGAGLLQAYKVSNKKIYQANCLHPLFSDIQSLLLKHTGIDQIIDKVINGLGGLHSAYVIGSFARGKDNPSIDLLLVGNDIDSSYLLKMIERAEIIIRKRIRHISVGIHEAHDYMRNYPEALLLWRESDMS